MKKSFFSSFNNAFGLLVILLSLIASYFIYHRILGHPENFVNADPSAEPIEGNYLGVIHKGGPIIIVQIAFVIILFTYIIERALVLYLASGGGNNKSFARKVGGMITSNKMNEVIKAAEQQKGAVANVIFKGVSEYQKTVEEKNLSPEEKAYFMKNELEEASHLEVPVLERNMIIISTLASIATLVGLLGTVTGMIRAFSALARSGAPDAVGLAGGISQALVTTAIGISTAAIAIVFYNLYTNTIDKITYAIDELNYQLLHQLKSFLKKEPKEIKPNQEVHA